MNTLSIAVVGGDLRFIRLAEKLSVHFTVYTYGIGTKDASLGIKQCTKLEEIKVCDYIIGPIPLSKDHEHIYMPLSQKKVTIKELCEVCGHKKLFAGVIKESVKSLFGQYKIEATDLMEIESIAIANAVPTAEGAILYAMQNSEITLHDSRCVILGFGRCSKVLADKLKGIGAKVVIGARKIEDLTYAKAYGYECFSLKHLSTHLANCDFIFNTIPFILLDATTIECMDKKSVYIELASMPGGIDKEACKAKEIRYVEAPSLPGKVAPTTAAEIIYEALLLLFQKED